MVDALAAETGRGAPVERAFAFADYDGTSVGCERARDRWLAKSVEPILYDRRDDHRLLAETLIEWARIRRDPFLARSQIGINGISKMPAGLNDPVVERVVWALQDPVAAKALADEPPITDEDDFPKVERWLDMFHEEGLLSCVAVDPSGGAADQGPEVVRLVDSGYQGVTPYTLDQPRRSIARWIARHIHVPQVLGWVLRSGGHLHPGLRQEVKASLASPSSEIPPRLRLLWTIVSDAEPDNPWNLEFTAEQYVAARTETERRQIEDGVIRSIEPRLVALRGPSSTVTFRHYLENEEESVSPLNSCGHLRLMAGNRDTLDQFASVLGKDAVLSRHAETLTGYLEKALILAEDDDGFPSSSTLYRPSIADHQQNQALDEWVFLIDLVRDSHLALADTDRRRGDNLLQRWALSAKPLFKRLVLHALTDDVESDIHFARQLLVAGRSPGVWEWELRREVFRFLRVAGSRLPRRLRVEVVRAILAGPKGQARRILRPESIPHEKALRLHRLGLSGIRLNLEARALVQEAGLAAESEVDERDEFAAWQEEGGWISEEAFAPKDLVQGSIGDVVSAIEREVIGRDAYRGLALVKPVKAASALRRLAQRGRWPEAIWQGFLWGLPGRRDGEEHSLRLQVYLGRVLATAPGGLFADVGSAAADFIKDLAEKYGTDRECELAKLWEKAWSGVGSSLPEMGHPDDPLTQALNHPAGKLAEAALSRLRNYEQQEGVGLPAPVLPYFKPIGGDPDGHLGRVLLATRLHYLFTIDPDWTRKHLIARLSPGSTREATDLWSAFGWSPSVGPDLLLAIREPFLEVLCIDPGGSQGRANLIGLFISICLEAPNQLTPDEVQRVVGAMSDRALIEVLQSLTQRLRGEASDRGDTWQVKVRPWLERYWPQATGRNSAGTSKGVLAMLTECGDAFPDAAEWSLPYLRPIEGHDLYCLSQNGHAEQHPDYMLQVLCRVAEADILPGHQRRILRKILDTMQATEPALAADSRFQGLYRIATQ